MDKYLSLYIPHVLDLDHTGNHTKIKNPLDSCCPSSEELAPSASSFFLFPFGSQSFTLDWANARSFSFCAIVLLGKSPILALSFRFSVVSDNANSVSICIQIPIYPAAVQLGPFSLSISEEKSKNNCYLYILPKHSRILYAVLTPLFLSSPSFLYEEMLEQTD